MASAVERIVVQATAQDKQAIVAKAKQLDLPISELMRRGAFAYQAANAEGDMEALAEAAQAASERACAAIDDALDFIADSNLRIAAMEAAVLRRSPAASAKPAHRKAA